MRQASHHGQHRHAARRCSRSHGSPALTAAPRGGGGFTLVEMAVVLVIIGLLLGGLLIPLSTQMENDKRNETQATLTAIREALIGYAVINGSLPCHDTDGDGQPGPGSCNGGADQRNVGGLPYGLLGVSAADAWGRPWIYAVNGAYTGTIALGTPASITGGGNLEVWDGGGCGGARQFGGRLPAIVISEGKNRLGGALETENRDSDRCFTDAGHILGTAGFDDLLTWIAPGVLFNRMVAAGRSL